MKLTILGYYGGYPFDKVGTSAYLLASDNYHLLIDCGSGALLALEQNLDPLALNSVLLSHYHHDHTADIGVLQYYWQIRQADEHKTLPIYGPLPDSNEFTGLTWQHATKGFSYAPTDTLELGPFSITFIKTVHPVPAFAMRIIEVATGKVFVYTADTAYFDELIPFVRDANLLVTDTNFAASKTGNFPHMTSSQSGQLAQLGNVKRLIISHLPQTIDLNQLKQETIQTAGDIPVQLASEVSTITI